MRTRRAGPLEQLIDLGFPFTLYEQGPFVARGIPAVTLTTGGERPPAAFTDRASALDTRGSSAMGRATQELIGSLDQGLELAQGTTSFVWLGDRIVRGWAIELLLFAPADPVPGRRRRPVRALPAPRDRRSARLRAACAARLAFWLFLGLAFTAFRALGAWPAGVPRPPNPAVATSGDWPVLALVALGVICLAGWIVARQRLVPRRPVGPDEQLAGVDGGPARPRHRLVARSGNKPVRADLLPAGDARLALAAAGAERQGAAARPCCSSLGLLGPLLIIFSLAFASVSASTRRGTCSSSWPSATCMLPAVAITLCGAACAAQLAVVAAGRYAPYPPAGERPERGPLRELVRRTVLALRARRRTQESRRAVG